MGDHTIDWWKVACTASPTAIAFVSTSDRFKFANNAWCRLVGWSESELLQKRWQDITAVDDVGGDQGETEHVKDGDKAEYYLEKNYIRKDGTRTPIGLYVHRFPPYGDQKGYVVFAVPLGSAELRKLRAEFAALEQTVEKLEAGRLEVKELQAKIAGQDAEIKTVWSTVHSMLGKSNITTHVGDHTGGDKSGRDKTINDTKIIAIVALVLCISITAVVVALLGGNLKWDGGGQQIEINQPIGGNE